MKIIDRYLLREMLGPFFVGVIGFIMVLTVDLLFTMADLIINKGVPLWAMIKLLFFKLPASLVLTFPVSTLFGTAMAIGRLSQENEIIALRTSGVSVLRIARPLLLMGMVISFASFVTNEKIVPRANYIAGNIIRQIVNKQPLPDVKENIFFKDAYSRYYYAKRIDLKEKRMDSIMVYEITDENFPRVTTAQSANFTGSIWELKNGVIHKYDNKGRLNYEANFDVMKVNVSDEILKFSEHKSYTDMDRKELQEKITTLGKGGAATRELLTELYMKYSIPLSCFVFALVGVPFSLFSPRSGKTWGVVLTIVFMFTFYVFASVFRSLGRGGIVAPQIAAFTPQLLFIIIGSGLLYFKGERV